MVKVSVIIPVYNAEKYIAKCMDSLVNQTLDGIEIIAVNDGSTDNSLALLTEYQNKYPFVKIFTKENGGQGAARNFAINYAEGEYLGFVDADDYAELNMFEVMYLKAKEGDYDAVYIDHYEVKGDKKIYKKFCDTSSQEAIFKGCLVSPWNKLIKTKTYLESGVIFPEGYIYEDTAWFCNLIPFIKTWAKVDMPLVDHVVNENSTMTTRQEARTANIFPVMQQVLDFYNEKGLMEEYKDEVEYFYTRIFLLSSLTRVAKIKNKKLKKEMALKSISEVEKNFPDYKKNKYLSGNTGRFIKILSKKNIGFFTWLLGFKG